MRSSNTRTRVRTHTHTFFVLGSKHLRHWESEQNNSTRVQFIEDKDLNHPFVVTDYESPSFFPFPHAFPTQDRMQAEQTRRAGLSDYPC